MSTSKATSPRIAVATPGSKNRKTGGAHTTTSSRQTCAQECPFRKNGCYAEGYPMRFHWDRLDDAVDAAGASLKEQARAEAAAIAALPPTAPLRLKQAGDFPDEQYARIVAPAAEHYMRRSHQPAWTYTHSWRRIPREAFGQVSVLASCESPADARAAMDAGYAAAMVLPVLPADGKARTMADGTKVIPCPAQTKHKTCVECRLCFDDKALLERRAVIAFGAHGFNAGAVKRTIGE